jgi:predicted CXXCH cytochrome family protein
MKPFLLFRIMAKTNLKLPILSVLLIWMTILISCPAVWAALEKSSKKECAMCHVMWLDVFRTNKETLIKWQPGNVLMKDTQGIVSSEEVCYSCHDGYVADSRYIVWKNNNHTTFKKPSKEIKIPETLTLSNKDEIYCGTCHSPHSGRESVPGLSKDETIPGPRSFLRVANIDSGLCEACHVNKADFKRTNGHPVHTDKLTIPEKLFELGSVKAVKKDIVTCQTCHRVHGAAGRNLTIMDNSRSELCMLCHNQRSVAGTQHDLRVTMPTETNMKGQTLSESGPCGACHIPHESAGFRLWARKFDPGKPVSQICLSCHDEKPGSKIKGLGQNTHPNNVEAVLKKDQNRSGSLHITDKLPLFSSSGKPRVRGTIQCFTCHNVHQWDPASAEKKGGGKVEGNGSNSFLRISSSPASALCVECHRDKKSILSFDHNLARTAPEARNSRGDTVSISGPCGACHIPHNAVGKNLWARNGSKDNTSIPQYCTGCHSKNGEAKEKCVGTNDHPVEMVLKGPQIPPADRVIKILPLYNGQGGTESGDRILCLTCHDPHIWSVSDKGNAAYDASFNVTELKAKNIEGDARNSFLRMPTSPTADLCIVCHEDTALLVGTDHDLFVTAPSAKNRLGQTVTESGQCGVCHAVHNSPDKRLLWAQALGPVGKNQHSMNSICTGCHSKGGIAENKVPLTETHPAGLLINNIMTFDNHQTDYIKLYDDNWKEVNVGDLSCSSCHSFYRWDHRTRARGPGKNIEGDAENSFLRTSSDKTVCIDCHGETAIWRYTYYHSPQKREMIKNLRPQ